MGPSLRRELTDALSTWTNLKPEWVGSFNQGNIRLKWRGKWYVLLAIPEDEL